jgi:WD40 repeat protein
VTAIQFSQNTKSRYAAAYQDGCVAVWDTTKRDPLCVFKQHASSCMCVAFSSLNNILMATGGLDSSIALYDIAAKK